MAHAVTIRTGARLHFGLWGIHAPVGPQFGGVGMMIAEPGVELTARLAASEAITAPSQEVAGRVERVLQHLRGARPDIPPVAIDVAAAIDSHQGLGSGTQLALATAAAVLEATGTGPFDSAAWAHRLDRGQRSSIGVHGFQAGGLIVEDGQEPGDRIGALLGRVDVCPDWRIALVAPLQTSGLSGTAELRAFQQLPSMSDSTTVKLRRLAVDEWWPATASADFSYACRAMWDYGQLAGEYFRPVQGGVFSSPQMVELSEELKAAGWTGIAQTSWGPTIAILCRDTSHAGALDQRLKSNRPELRVRITVPQNHGAILNGAAAE